ncbi:hypothetical protein D3260_07865 [Salinisphaera sp. Q1T1-3]|nr:hypothetical protein D3260_07865 [Salinisphaera sp. Q1T1-3]
MALGHRRDYRVEQPVGDQTLDKIGRDQTALASALGRCARLDKSTNHRPSVVWVRIDVVVSPETPSMSMI